MFMGGIGLLDRLRGGGAGIELLLSSCVNIGRPLLSFLTVP